MNSPYQPPKSSNVSTPAERKNGSVVKAVLVGMSLDLIGTFVVSMVLAILYGIYLARSGVPQTEVMAILASRDPMAPHLLVLEVVGLGISYLAGSICCRIAGANARTAIAALATAMVAFNIAMGASVFPLWINVLLSGVLVFVYYLSYRFYLRGNDGSFESDMSA